MMARCYKPHHPGYFYSGGLGIKVFERWHDFWLFVEDMGERPEGMNLDRHDHDGDYEPGNCYWTTKAVMARNRRDNVYLEFQGKKVLLADAAEKYGVNKSVIRWRVANGWTVDEALTTPADVTKSHRGSRSVQERS